MLVGYPATVRQGRFTVIGNKHSAFIARAEILYKRYNTGGHKHQEPGETDFTVRKSWLITSKLAK